MIHNIPHFAEVNGYLVCWSAGRMDVSEIIARMKKLLSVRTDLDLAKHLSVSNQAISSWRSRNSMPLEYLMQVSTETEKSVDYLIHGRTARGKPPPGSLEVLDLVYAGGAVLRGYLREYGESKISDLTDDQIAERGDYIGNLMFFHATIVKHERERLLETGKFDADEFENYARELDRFGKPREK